MSVILTPEEKFVAKLVSVMCADATIAGYVKGRVYSSHISSIQEPDFPAISIFMLYTTPRFESPDSVSLAVQVDAWMPMKNYNNTDVSAMTQRIRALLHRANLSDKTLGLIVGQCVCTEAGRLMYEEDTGLFHFPSIIHAEVL